MNDFVLRGFCNTCGFPIYLKEEKVYHATSADTPTTMAIYGQCKRMDPVWFLSAKQMKIVWRSDEFIFWCADSKNSVTDFNSLCVLLLTEPFLVARILKEAGEKE